MNAAIFKSSYDEEDQESRFQCRHIKISGHRCQCPALRGEKFCYYHHTTRRAVPKQEAQRRKSNRATFDMPFPEDRASIQHTLGMVIQRLATNDLDPRRAGLLLYALQIASTNLPKEDLKKLPIPTVDEIILEPELDAIAPETLYNPDLRVKGPAERFLDSIRRRRKAEEAAKAQAVLPTLQATATPPLTPIPSGLCPKTPEGTPTLKQQLQPKLNLPTGISRRRDHTRRTKRSHSSLTSRSTLRRPRRINNLVRQRKIRMVQDVEELRAELQPHRLGDLRRLQQ